MTDEEKADTITAKLNGHDPGKWSHPYFPKSQKAWYVYRHNSPGSKHFGCKEDAVRFHRTGVLPPYYDRGL